MEILSGDIGGTKTRIALYRWGADHHRLLQEQTYPSSDYDSLDRIVAEFLGELEHAPPVAAGFGIAGPVAGRRCATTNLPWQVDADRLQERLEIPDVQLLNDLEAAAWGIPLLDEGDLLTLQTGTEAPHGNQLVIAAGTGLGEAGICRAKGGYEPFGSEGGHCSFAPADEREFRLLQSLQAEYGHVSWERIVSGPGLVALYRFLLAEAGRESPLLAAADPAAAISQAADAGEDPIAVEALGWFVRLYGAEAGNHALKLMARGGVYIGGGIAPKILDWLRGPAFLDAFLNKGRMRPLLEQMPVRVILNERNALLGPAYYQWLRHKS